MRKFTYSRSLMVYLLVIIIAIQILLFIPRSLGKYEQRQLFGDSAQDKVKAGQKVSYEFPNNNKIQISGNVSIDLSIEYDEAISNRQIGINIRNSEDISFKIHSETSLNNFGRDDSPGQGGNKWRYNYDCIYRFYSNASIKEINLSFQKDSEYGLNPESSYTIAYLTSKSDNWQEIETEEVSFNSSEYLEGNITELDPNISYYITLYEIEEDPQGIFDWNLVFFIGIIAVILLALVLTLTKTQFLNYIKTRTTPIEKGAHQLDLEAVLENENRNKIIDLILKEPGIHFNDILRKTELAPGNLVWHLDMLETYKIIGKKRISNYVAYFPYYPKNPISNIDLKLSKSKLTLEILNIIEDNPGIYNSLITKKKKVDHKTVYYHIKKLMDLGLVYFKKKGRKKKLYPNFDSEYYQDNQN